MLEIDADASPLVVQDSVSVRQVPFVKIHLPKECQREKMKMRVFTIRHLLIRPYHFNRKMFNLSFYLRNFDLCTNVRYCN